MAGELGAIPQSLFTDVCPNCGYSLKGLAATGTCPECGKAYDQSEIILYGWARGLFANAGNAKPSRVVWCLLCSPMIMDSQTPLLGMPALSWGILIGMANVGMFVHSVGMWLAVWAVPYVLNFYLLLCRANNDHPGTVRVHLTENGCIQEGNLGGPSAVEDFLASYPYVVPIVLIFLYWVGSQWFHASRVMFWLGLVWVGCYSMIFCLGYIDKRMRARKTAWAAAVESARGIGAIKPWNTLGKYSLAPASPGTYRLKIKFYDRMYYQRGAVDAEIICTPEQAQQVKEVLQSRLRR